jgi:hypothetical protein
MVVNCLTLMQQPPTNVQKVFLIFSNKQAGLGPISAELTKAGEGQYSVSVDIILENGK